MTRSPPATARFATLYGESAGRIYLQEVATAGWIARSLPAEARLASLVTSIEYLTGRSGFSLNGIANPALAGNRDVEIFSYPGCSHAFARHTGTHYDAAAAEKANARTADFLRRRLAMHKVSHGSGQCPVGLARAGVLDMLLLQGANLFT